MRNFEDFINAYLDFTSSHEATPRLHTWSCISILAAALERKVYLERGYYRLFPNLYTFLIGQSGLVKKSTTTGIAVNLLRELPAIKIMSERLTAAGLVNQLSTSHKTFELNGKQIKQASVFAYASELSVFLMEVYGSIVELLTTFYDCQPYDSTKPWTNMTKGEGTTNIYGPCLNLLGASTHSWLKKCIPESEMEGGFSSRVIFVVENRIPTKLVPWPHFDKAKEEMRQKLIQDLTQIYNLRGEFKITQGAYDIYSQWYNHHMTEIVPHSYEPRFNGYLGRKGDLVLKLAMIRSISLNNELTLNSEDIVWAVEKLDELEPEMKEAFREENLDLQKNSELMSYEVLRFIETKGPVSHFQIVKTFIDSKKITRQTLFEALQHFQIQGLIGKTEKLEDGGKTVLYHTRSKNL